LKSELVSLLTQIKSLPYGRNTDRANFLLVPKEQKGTCSTKHAYIKHVALQENWEEVKLFIGIYLMNDFNTPGVGEVLHKYDLSEIPEAHTYLKINGEVVDITGLDSSNESFQSSLQREEEILPDQIGDYKIKLHQDFISYWAQTYMYSADGIWNIREKCILALTRQS